MHVTNWREPDNLTMLTDFYELTMGNGYFLNGQQDTVAYFDLFFRKVPDGGGFAIVAGLEQAIDYLQNLRFSEGDIEYLRSKGGFDEGFLDYLRKFEFSCDVWAIPEGTPVFPGEPLMMVRGPVIQAQLVETMLLLILNHQTLIATKANRIVRAAEGRTVMEFGSRRAQGASGALYGARAAYIGGCSGSSNTMADRDFGVPALGTMAHSWVQAFPTELDAFKTYARHYPDNCVLLVDTYNTLQSGIPNAITTFKEDLLPSGFRPKGIRIDSGDIAYLSKEARKMLDDAGFPDVKIVASNSLDEYLIRDLLLQGARVDQFGVGERLVTAKSDPVFGGVYKLVAVEEHGSVVPKIKVSENVEKITLPGFKQVYRLFNPETGKALADLITLADEPIPQAPYTIFDPNHTWKKKYLASMEAKPLLVPVFVQGKCVYSSPSMAEIRAFSKQQVAALWDEVLRFENPHRYYVDLSKPLWDLRASLIQKYSEGGRHD